MPVVPLKTVTQVCAGLNKPCREEWLGTSAPSLGAKNEALFVRPALAKCRTAGTNADNAARVALLPYQPARAGRHNPKGTERDDQDRALRIMSDRHGPTTPVRLVVGQTGGRHHEIRKPLGSRMRYTNVREIVPDVIAEALFGV